MKKLQQIAIIITSIICINLNAQGVFVNRVFQDLTGSPQFNPALNTLGLQWSNSLKHSNGHIYTVGYTTISGQGQNVYLTKYTPDGLLVWAMDYPIAGASNDYGIGLTQTASGNLILVGATDNGGSFFDMIALKVDANTGALLGSPLVKDGSGLNDVAVSVTENSTGNIYIAGNTENAPGLSNYWVLKCDAALNVINTNIYDFAGLPDIAIGIEVTTGGNICLIGASASSPTSSDYAAVVFDANTLTYLNDERNNIPGTAQDQALAFCKDASGNIYITGKAWNGNNYDIKIFRVNANFTTGWSSSPLDVYGFDDVANAIAVDPVSGDVIIAGYATKSNTRKEIIIARYNGTSGVFISSHKQASEDNNGDAFIRDLQTNSNGDIYFIGSEKGNAGFKQVLVGKIKTSGNISWQRKVVNTTQDILPSDLSVQSDGIYAISILDSVAKKYILTKYTDMELDTAKGNYGTAKFKDNEVIVRFRQSAMNTTAVNNTGLVFGDLQDLITSSAYSQVKAALVEHRLLDREAHIKAIKIFPGIKVEDSTSISRLNETIAIPDFWTALLLVFPNGSSVTQITTLLNTLPSFVSYSEPNFLARVYSVPNDSLFAQQYSLRSNTVYPNADVNATEAWDVIHNGGKPFVRAGIFDTPINWEHKDFNYNGTNPSSSKVVDGWSYTWNAPVKTMANGGAFGDFHASCVGGIIGAQRNNISGIAGIAGGNDSTGSKGISLYNPAIFDPGGSPTISVAFAPLTYIADAIFETALDPATNTNVANAYKLNLQNHSWGLEAPLIDPGFANQSITLFKEAIHSVNRLNVTAIAARGNNIGTTLTYPANADDDWVICVSGTGINGQFGQMTNVTASPINCELTSGWGGDIDLAAPCSGSLITTLSTPNPASTVYPGYQNFGGTSAAAPHVSGAVGLMMSYMNDTTGNQNYRNLAPEDCEAILQITATDTDSSGYDQLTGFGRLNVGKALKKIQKPYHNLLHFGTNNLSPYTISKVLTGSTTTVNTTERFQKPLNSVHIQPGQFKVKAFKITSTVNHNISPQDTIIAYWPRPSSSVTWNLFAANGGTNFLTPREKTKIISLNQSTAVLEGYVYQVTDMSNNPLGWWPVDTAFAQTYYGKWAEYSVLVRNYSGLHTAFNKQSLASENISLFPNPTNGNQTLEIVADNASNLSIELFDMLGRQIKTVYSGKTDGSRTTITQDVTNLPNSLYIYKITINGETTSRKFIKQ
ncbi:MAG: S8 family serine peptidase [Bacteroidia bacterium]|nr:S8 family serine peptidase [Bacteroidia bacterium]